MQNPKPSLLAAFPFRPRHEIDENTDPKVTQQTSQSADTSSHLDHFLNYVQNKNVELYPAQEEAILELFSGKNVILNTPTGSGKSLVATSLHFKSYAEGKKSVYTCPIKALVNEKFLALCHEFGPENVGMITGDATVNADAPILCCTAEILSNIALRTGKHAPFSDVIMDEFHYYSDRDRGMAWQIPLLTMSNARFLLMSATLGETAFFEKCLTDLNGRETALVYSNVRPVPLDFKYVETPIHETIDLLVRANRIPIYVVNFTQRECAEVAQDLLSVDFCTKEEKKAILQELEHERFKSPYGKELQRVLKHGIGIHHAGLLPRYRVLIERLAQKGLLKIICGTDTLGVGVNVPIRTVLFTKLCKFDGQKTTLLSVRDFQQISGRAGRKGFDNEGWVVAQAPEHVIENIRMEAKASDPKKAKKLVKRKPPEKGYVPWSKETFQKLIESKPEPLMSRFQVGHGMLLNVLSRPNDPCGSMRSIIRQSHESDHSKKFHRKRAFELFRSLVDRKIVEIIPKGERKQLQDESITNAFVAAPSKLRVNVDLQQDFSLNQTLSLYLLDTLQLLDQFSPDYAFELLTQVESILENPDLILRKQLDRIKSIKMDEMKMEGIEFDERIEALERLEYPKPNSEFIYTTFNKFSDAHPWVGQENIRPKSIAREMYEHFHSFNEYIRELDLQRAEGLLLRYLSDVYKVLSQTVPDEAKTDEVFAMTVYFGTCIRQVDSSLLDEWEKLRNPDHVVHHTSDEEVEIGHSSKDLMRHKKELIVQVRNDIWRIVRALSTGDFEQLLPLINEFPGTRDLWTSDEIESIMKIYFTDHSRITTDTKARNPSLTTFTTEADGVELDMWSITQTLSDPDGHDDWAIDFSLDLNESRQKGKPVLSVARIYAI